MREKFSAALQEYARHAENVFLVTVLDVDKRSRDSEGMRKWLEKIDYKSGPVRIEDTDKLLLVFPKINIETWFMWLMADENERINVNETDDYKQKVSRRKGVKPGKLGEEVGEMFLDIFAASGNRSELFPSMQDFYISWKNIIELL